MKGVLILILCCVQAILAAPDQGEVDGSQEPSRTNVSAWTETTTRGGTAIVVIHTHDAQTDAEGLGSPVMSSDPTVSTSATTEPQSTETGVSTAPTSGSTHVPESVISTDAPEVSSSIITSDESSSSSDTSSWQASVPHHPLPSSYSTNQHVDSAEHRCTGGNFRACVQSYNCDGQSTEAERCRCRNNVMQSCAQSCAVSRPGALEICPLSPGTPRPPGVPDAGSTPKAIRRGKRAIEKQEEPINDDVERGIVKGATGNAILRDLWPVLPDVE